MTLGSKAVRVRGQFGSELKRRTNTEKKSGRRRNERRRTNREKRRKKKMWTGEEVRHLMLTATKSHLASTVATKHLHTCLIPATSKNNF